MVDALSLLSLAGIFMQQHGKHIKRGLVLKSMLRHALTCWQLPNAALAVSFWQGRVSQQSAAAAQPRRFRLMHCAKHLRGGGNTADNLRPRNAPAVYVVRN